jgi:hypothetical protein
MTKISLATVLALGFVSSLSAIEDVKITGEAKVIYQTTDQENSAGPTGMFEKGNGNGEAARAGASLTIGANAKLSESVTGNVEAQAFSTLGLEKNLVSGVMATGSTDTQGQVSQASLTAKAGKTTVVVGRQELNTPLAFTEKWNVVKNTFDAAVVQNNDIENTTLVGAWVGNHNGISNYNGTTGVITAGTAGNLVTSAGQTATLKSFETFGTDGAYAVGAVSKAIPDTTLQAWYYNVVDVAQATWFQGDTKVAGNVTLGAQYATMNPEAAGKTSSIWAVKAGTEVAGVNVYGAYSSADEDGTLGFANVSTGDKTMIYTGLDSVYMDGIVTRPGNDTFKVGASKELSGVKLATSYTDCSSDTATNEIKGWDVSASTKVGGATVQAIYTSFDTQGTANYANKDRDTLRLVGSYKF